MELIENRSDLGREILALWQRQELLAEYPVDIDRIGQVWIFDGEIGGKRRITVHDNDGLIYAIFQVRNGIPTWEDVAEVRDDQKVAG